MFLFFPRSRRRVICVAIDYVCSLSQGVYFKSRAGWWVSINTDLLSVVAFKIAFFLFLFQFLFFYYFSFEREGAWEEDGGYRLGAMNELFFLNEIYDYLPCLQNPSCCLSMQGMHIIH